MKQTLCGIVAVIFALLLASCADHQGLRPPPPQTDSALNGTWILKSAEFAGKPFASPSGFGVRIRGNRYDAGVPPNNYNDHGSLIFFGDELAGEPGRLDVIGEDGPNKGKRYPAIYRLLSARELEICYDLSGQERPREFVSREQTSQFRVSYVRK